MFPVEDGGCARVSSHLLHVCFMFVESSIYMEEVRKSDSRQLQQSVSIAKSIEDEGHCWYLPLENYRAYGLPMSLLSTSTENRSRISENSTVDMPCIHHVVSPSPPRDVSPSLRSTAMLRTVKIEKLDTIIELSSESEGEYATLSLHKIACGNQTTSNQMAFVHSVSNTPSNSPTQSFLNRPPFHPTPVDRVSIMESLRRFIGVHRCRNELSTMDLDTVEHHRVQFLPPVFDGDVIFELPPCPSSSSSSSARNLQGMDKRYDGHPWCKLVTTNIHNSDNLKFRKSYCAGHLSCENIECDYLKRASKKNETEWTGYTVFPFAVGDTPPRDCTLVCKICKKSPTCLSTRDARMYYSYNGNDKMRRAAIHLGSHAHPVAKGMYRDSAEKICGLIAEQVAKTPTATNSAIALC